MIRITLILLLASLSVTAQSPFSLHDLAYATSTSPLRQGLVSYWRLEEASGLRLDYGKSSNQLASSNSVGQTTGIVGNCATFGGASLSNALVIPSNSTLQVGSGSFYVAAWVKMITKTTTQMFVGKDDGLTVADSEYYLGFDNSSQHLIWQALGATHYRVDEPTQPSTNVWMLLQGWYDQPNAKVWIRQDDKTPVSGVVTNPINSTITPFAIGACVSTNKVENSFADANIDEVGIWKRILTTKEQQQLYNPSSGTNVATLQSGATWSASVPTPLSANVNSLSLDGINDYANVVQNIVIPANSWLICYWFKANSLTSVYQIGNVSGANTYAKIQSSTVFRFQTDTVSTFKDFTVPTMSTGVWYHVIWYNDGANTHCYLNGTESSSGGQAQANVTTFNQFGKYFDGSFGGWFSGNIADVQFYNYVPSLSAAEITTLENGGTLSIIPKARYKFLEGTGTTAVDTGYSSRQGTHFPWAHP